MRFRTRVIWFLLMSAILVSVAQARVVRVRGGVARRTGDVIGELAVVPSSRKGGCVPIDGYPRLVRMSDRLASRALEEEPPADTDEVTDVVARSEIGSDQDGVDRKNDDGDVPRLGCALASAGPRAVRWFTDSWPRT